jgi:hypothetical protein
VVDLVVEVQQIMQESELAGQAQVVKDTMVPAQMVGMVLVVAVVLVVLGQCLMVGLV